MLCFGFWLSYLFLLLSFFSYIGYTDIFSFSFIYIIVSYPILDSSG